MENKQLPEEVELALMEALLDLPEGSLRETAEQKAERDRVQCLREIQEAKQDTLDRQLADAFGLPVREEIDPALAAELYDALVN